MGVIDEYLELSFRGNDFESAGNLRRLGETRDRVTQIYAERISGGQCGHRIRDVEAADERQTHEITFPARVETIRRAAKLDTIV